MHINTLSCTPPSSSGTPLPLPQIPTQRGRMLLFGGAGLLTFSWPLGSAEGSLRHGHSLYPIWINFLVDVLPLKSK